MTFTLVLGNKNYSSWSLRAWLVLRKAGAKFDEIVVPLDTERSQEEIARHSPSGRVPALRDGSLIVWDSLAIAEYAHERFPAANLWPSDAFTRAAARSVSCEMHAGFGELRRQMPFNTRGRARLTPGDDAVRADVKRVTTIWKNIRRTYGEGGPFLFGHFTIADAMFAPVASRFRTYGVHLDGAALEYANTLLDMTEFMEWDRDAKNEAFTLPKVDALLL